MLFFVVNVFVFVVVDLLISDKGDEHRIVASSWDCLVLQIFFKELLPEGLGRDKSLLISEVLLIDLHDFILILIDITVLIVHLNF